MTNEERAHDLVYNVSYSPNFDNSMKFILAYADEIRRECMEAICVSCLFGDLREGKPCEIQDECISWAAIMGKEVGK